MEREQSTHYRARPNGQEWLMLERLGPGDKDACQIAARLDEIDEVVELLLRVKAQTGTT